MKAKTLRTLATTIIVMACSYARADIINGDFSTGGGSTANWDVSDSEFGAGLASHEIVDYSDNSDTFHADTEIKYNWNGSEWVLPSTIDVATVTLIQPESGVMLEAPEDTTKLRFKASSVYKRDGIAETPTARQISVTLTWEKKTDSSIEDINEVSINDDAFKMYEINITDQNVIDNIEDYKFTITALTNCLRNSGEPGGQNQGDEMDVEIDAYFDDFEFVPEPAAFALLLGGGLITLLRKRRT